ncbi:MAG: hypothetical protein KH281_12245, partial [Lachnospiraceae bacterium]|nr:hypothetical protein [Lachnospiraceae bacterium]
THICCPLGDFLIAQFKTQLKWIAQGYVVRRRCRNSQMTFRIFAAARRTRVPPALGGFRPPSFSAFFLFSIDGFFEK